ncbi:hypothetical protein C4573_03190 [Candidatus Woesearchaeota archaeon]|nr:MAG: hypothetical protein C4573_03190 [Candidatus Woesearchaeota archaeon]
MNETVELKKLLTAKKLIIGTNTVMRALRAKHLKKIYLANNCAPDTKKDFEKYAKMLQVELLVLDMPNEDLGTLCKKPFFVSVVGVKQ